MELNNHQIFGHLFEHLSSDWKLKRLSDIVDFQEGPGILAKDFYEEGIPLLRLSSISEAKTNFNGCNYLDPIKFKKKWSHFTLKEGDILLSTSGSLGRVSEVAKEQEGSICYTGIIRFRPKIKELKYSYIKYFLQSKLFEQQALACASGSVLKHFGPSHLKTMSIPLPDEKHQSYIEKQIRPIDDKIALNNKTNEILGQIAQALFKSWFVDFDPVKAKAEGGELDVIASELGISKEILALFPDEFEESQLGLIPKGWEVKSLDKIAHYQNGLALQKFRPEDENDFLPVVKIAQLNKGFADGEEKASPNIKPECIINNGDVIFSWSGSLIVDIWCGGKAALNQHLFKVTSNDYPKWFYLFYTKQHLDNFQRIASGKAVTMGHIKREHLTQALCVVPNEIFLAKISKFIGDIVQKIIDVRLENQTLTQLRDTLLPKLLSGEITIDSAIKTDSIKA